MIRKHYDSLIGNIFFFLLLVSRKEELPLVITGDFFLMKHSMSEVQIVSRHSNSKVSFSIIFPG